MNHPKPGALAALAHTVLYNSHHLMPLPTPLSTAQRTRTNTARAELHNAVARQQAPLARTTGWVCSVVTDGPRVTKRWTKTCGGFSLRPLNANLQKNGSWHQFQMCITGVASACRLRKRRRVSGETVTKLQDSIDSLLTP